MLILNITDNFLQEIFHCNQTSRTAIFISNYSNLDTLMLHHLQHFSR